MTTGVRRRDLLAVGGAAAALTPLVGLARGRSTRLPAPTMWWAPDDQIPLRPAATLRSSPFVHDDLRLIVEGRAGTGSKAAIALRHPTLPDLWHTVWADDGRPGGEPPGVAVRLLPDAAGAVHLALGVGDEQHLWSLRRGARLGGLRIGRWVAALPTPGRARPRLGGLTVEAARGRPDHDLLLLRVEADAPTHHVA